MNSSSFIQVNPTISIRQSDGSNFAEIPPDRLTFHKTCWQISLSPLHLQQRKIATPMAIATTNAPNFISSSCCLQGEIGAAGGDCLAANSEGLAASVILTLSPILDYVSHVSGESKSAIEANDVSACTVKELSKCDAGPAVVSATRVSSHFVSKTFSTSSVAAPISPFSPLKRGMKAPQSSGAANQSGCFKKRLTGEGPFSVDSSRYIIQTDHRYHAFSTEVFSLCLSVCRHALVLWILYRAFSSHDRD